jgi:hypothetical protein
MGPNITDVAELDCLNNDPRLTAFRPKTSASFHQSANWLD